MKFLKDLKNPRTMMTLVYALAMILTASAGYAEDTAITAAFSKAQSGMDEFSGLLTGNFGKTLIGVSLMIGFATFIFMRSAWQKIAWPLVAAIGIGSSMEIVGWVMDLD